MVFSKTGLKWLGDESTVDSIALHRRGYFVGNVQLQADIQQQDVSGSDSVTPCFFAEILLPDLPHYQTDIAASDLSFKNLVSGQGLEDVFADRLGCLSEADGFELLSSSFDESDKQQIERLDFDVPVENSEPEEVWVKASKLSYDENDASLRFRFSFGMDGYESVGENPWLASLAARLAEKIFPECAVIVKSEPLYQQLVLLTGESNLAFVERIIYFNAPGGGAQFHQDVEPGHFGIVYAQLTGSTAWLALSKRLLVKNIADYLCESSHHQAMQDFFTEQEFSQLLRLANSREQLSGLLDSRQDLMLDKFVNQYGPFARCLIEQGHGFYVSPGDVLWLPQADMENCVWHSVFCASAQPGEALSFAVRASV